MARTVPFHGTNMGSSPVSFKFCFIIMFIFITTFISSKVLNKFLCKLFKNGFKERFETLFFNSIFNFNFRYHFKLSLEFSWIFLDVIRIFRIPVGLVKKKKARKYYDEPVLLKYDKEINSSLTNFNSFLDYFIRQFKLNKPYENLFFLFFSDLVKPKKYSELSKAKSHFFNKIIESRVFFHFRWK